MRFLLLLFLSFFALANACNQVRIFSRAAGSYLTAGSAGSAPFLTTTPQSIFCIVNGVIETSDGLLSLQQPNPAQPGLIFGHIANGGVVFTETAVDSLNWLFSYNGMNLQSIGFDISSLVLLDSPTGDSKEDWQIYALGIGGSSSGSTGSSGSGSAAAGTTCNHPFYLYSKALGYYVTPAHADGGFAVFTTSPQTLYCMSAAGVISVVNNYGFDLYLQTNTPGGILMVFGPTPPNLWTYVMLDAFDYIFSSDGRNLQSTWNVGGGLLLDVTTGDAREQFQAYDINLTPLTVPLNS